MKVSCLLASFNRPRFIRQALESVANQTYQNFELIVMDDGSDLFDVKQMVASFRFRDATVLVQPAPTVNRRTQNRLGINMNMGLSLVNGDLVCFLADDDYYYPSWFEKAVEYFKAHPEAHALFGKLMYTKSAGMEFPTDGFMLFPHRTLDRPACLIDHNQFMHRKMSPPARWTEDGDSFGNADACYLNEVGKVHLFYPLPEYAAVKRVHDKCLQRILPHNTISLEGPRE
jgi:glycosyltransferase involved in cell wall biosynthesis